MPLPLFGAECDPGKIRDAPARFTLLVACTATLFFSINDRMPMAHSAMDGSPSAALCRSSDKRGRRPGLNDVLARAMQRVQGGVEGTLGRKGDMRY